MDEVDDKRGLLLTVFVIVDFILCIVLHGVF